MKVRQSLVALAALAAAACGADFTPANELKSVRILATRADLPYARPGEQVTLQTLAVDARSEKPLPMRLSYIPTICTNPQDDDPTKCYGQISADLPFRKDIDGTLSAGDSFTFEVPSDIITARGSSQGEPPSGTAFVFLIACAGHVQLVENNSSYETKSPFICVDDGGNELAADDFVFAFAQIYAFDSLRNANPVLDSVSFEGTVVDEKVGFQLPACAASDDAKCPKKYVDAEVPASSQELDPAGSTPDLIFREELTVSYFADGAKLESDKSTLYDARSGEIAKTKLSIAARAEAGTHTLYAVVRDNRGGVAWKTFPFTIQ